MLDAEGKYTIKVTAIGTSGEEVSADDIVFYYGVRPTVPDTGTLTIFGHELSSGDLSVILLAVIILAGLGLHFTLKNFRQKGANNE